MTRGSEAFQVLKSFLKPTLWILLSMTFLRALLFLFIFYDQVQMHPDLPAAFWAGFRFDLLVLGFFWIPVVVLTWLSAFALWPRKLFQIWKLYFILVILIIFVLSWFDFFWTSKGLMRLNHEFLESSASEILKSGWLQMGVWPPIVVSACLLISALALIFSIYQLQWKDFTGKNRTATGILYLQVLISLFMVAFAARGTWTPHHLNIEHSLVSEDSRVNQLPLNPVWNLDK